jgi:hypothetical protein
MFPFCRCSLLGRRTYLMIRTICQRALGILLAIVAASPALATSYSWNAAPASAFFNNSLNWTPTGVPTGGDTASFGQLGTYYVFFETSPTIDDLNVLAGNVTFASFIQPPINFGPQTLTVSDTVSLPNANGNTSLILGGLGLIPLTLNTHILSVQNGANLTVQAANQVNAVSFGSGLNGNLIVDSAQINISPMNISCCDPITIGTFGGSGSLTLQNGAIADFGDLPFGIGIDIDNPSSGTGVVSVTSGSTLSTNDMVELADGNLNSTANLNINGTNSAFSQSDHNASITAGITVGSPVNGTATINVGATASGGTLTTGARGLVINRTGTVNVGSASTTGTLNANGDVTVNGGLLQVFSGSLFNLAAGKTLHIQNGGTAYFESFNINGSNIDFVTGSLTYAGNLLVGTGSPLGADLVLASKLQLTLTGTTSVDASHLLSIDGGSLHTGSIVNNGMLVFYTGTFATGTATLNANSELDVDLGGTTRNTKYCALVASGSVSLAGALVVTLNFVPVAGNSFDILDWGSVTGTFSSIQLPTLRGGLAWNTSQLYLTGVISVTGAAAVAGDYNGNGIVDAADYTIWRDTLGSTTDLRANGDNTGASADKIDQADFNVWKSNFGNHSGSGAGTNAAVPEPAALWMLLTGILAMCVRRRTSVS